VPANGSKPLLMAKLKNLKLARPMIFFDLEATGTNPQVDRIVEICVAKLHPGGESEVKSRRINPECPIPAEATEIHGITNEDVVNEPTFAQVSASLYMYFENSDLAGYNINRYDIPLLAAEFKRAGLNFQLEDRRVVDAQTIFHKMEKRTLAAAYKFYCQKELVDAHSAMADTKATYEVLKSQLDMYQGMEYEDNKGKKTTPIVNDVEKLSEFSSYDRNVDFVGRIVYDENGVEVFNFGKNKGVPVEQVLEEQPGYFGWIMNSEFPLYTKKVLTQIKLRMMNK